MDGWMDGGFLKWGYPAENFHYKPSILGTSPFSYIILYIYIYIICRIYDYRYLHPQMTYLCH